MANKKLRIWLITGSHDPAISLYLRKKFSTYESQSNVKIQLELITWERILAALIEAFKNNTAPDIVQLGTSWVRTFAHMGYLARIPEYLKSRPSINEGINRICLIDGVRYAVPWLVDTIIMAGRKDYMSLLGISKDDIRDWEGLMNVAKRIKKMKEEDPEIPKAVAVALKLERDTIQRFFSVLWARGWDFPNLDIVPERIIMDPVVLDTIKYFAIMKKICDRPEDINKHPYQVNEDFYRHGLAVFYIGSWYGIINRVNRMEQDMDDYCVLPFPTSGNKTCSYGGGTVLAVSSKSRLKEEAWNLVEYLISDDFMDGWAVTAVHAPAFESKFWQRRYTDERVRLMYEQTINSKIYPLHPAWLAIENELVKGIGYTIFRFLNKETNGGIGLDDYSILAETDERIRRILKINQEVRYLD